MDRQQNELGLPTLHIRRLRLETQHEPIALMHADCPVAKSEGFAARARVELSAAGRSAMATLYYVRDDLLSLREVGLSEAVWRRLGAEEGAPSLTFYRSAAGAVFTQRYGCRGERRKRKEQAQES